MRKIKTLSHNQPLSTNPRKVCKITMSAEKMTLQSTLYTKPSAKRRNPKATSRGLANVVQH